MPKESTSREKNRNSNEWVWQKQYNTFPLSESKLTIDGEVLLTFLNTPTPYDIFCKVVGWDDLVLLLKNESERYAQQNGRIFSTTTEEISAFMGVNFLMGINNLPIREYWSTSEGLGNSLIQKVMTRNRFMEILRNIHLSDNNQTLPPKDSPEYDRAWKLRHLFDHLQKHFIAAL